MKSTDVLEIYNNLESYGVFVWIDGGWSIDALLERQTRSHEDMDIAVARKDSEKLQKFFVDEGYTEVFRDDSCEFMYVMQNKNGHCVDVHIFEYNEHGENVYGILYPFGSLTGIGSIDNQKVRCIAPQFMLSFKTNYEPREKDIADVQALCAYFHFAVPTGYK